MTGQPQQGLQQKHEAKTTASLKAERKSINISDESQPTGYTYNYATMVTVREMARSSVTHLPANTGRERQLSQLSEAIS